MLWGIFLFVFGFVIGQIFSFIMLPGCLTIIIGGYTWVFILLGSLAIVGMIGYHQLKRFWMDNSVKKKKNRKIIQIDSENDVVKMFQVPFMSDDECF